MNERPAFPIGVNVLVVKEGKLLLGQRKNTSGEGDWGLPGGHLEKGERMEDGARRELEEETGLRADLEFVNLANGWNREPHYIHASFLARNIQGEPRLMEPEKCSEWKWFSLDNLPKNIFVGHRQTIEAFLKHETFSD